MIVVARQISLRDTSGSRLQLEVEEIRKYNDLSRADVAVIEVTGAGSFQKYIALDHDGESSALTQSAYG